MVLDLGLGNMFYVMNTGKVLLILLLLLKTDPRFSGLSDETLNPGPPSPYDLIVCGRLNPTSLTHIIIIIIIFIIIIMPRFLFQLPSTCFC